MSSYDTTDTDTLLTHYLSLVHTYTTLRDELSRLTVQMHSHLARANFLSDRGRHYGAGDYDDRMRSTISLSISTQTESEFNSPLFGFPEPRPSEDMEALDADEKDQDGDLDEEARENEQEEDGGSRKKVTQEDTRRNAILRQFGILVPPSLRQAQCSAEVVVKELIPKLASADAEMRAVEIEVRRARKRAKKFQEREGRVMETEKQAGTV